jgi:hypothetical protein
MGDSNTAELYDHEVDIQNSRICLWRKDSRQTELSAILHAARRASAR